MTTSGVVGGCASALVNSRHLEIQCAESAYSGETDFGRTMPYTSSFEALNKPLRPFNIFPNGHWRRIALLRIYWTAVSHSLRVLITVTVCQLASLLVAKTTKRLAPSVHAWGIGLGQSGQRAVFETLAKISAVAPRQFWKA